MGHFVQVIDAEDSKSETDGRLKAYRRLNFIRPIQYKPNKLGSIEERAMAAEEASDPINARVENRAQFVEGMNVYLDPATVNVAFRDFTLAGESRHLTKRKIGSIGFDYHMHCDPAKVNDDFAVMICHYEMDGPDEFGISYRHMIVDWYNIYRSSQFESKQIEYRPIMNDIKQLMIDFRLKTVSFDQFNSVMPIQDLSEFANSHHLSCRVFEETFTGSKNMKMYENMKVCMNEHWCHSYYDDMNEWESSRCMLQAELESLQYVKGRVVKPRTANLGHSDLVDCFMVLAWRLLADQTSNRSERFLDSVVSSDSDRIIDSIAPDTNSVKPGQFHAQLDSLFS